jgi:hypothetical protein
VPEGSFRLGRWGWTVSIIAAGYLGLIFIDIAYPSGLSSPRAFFNLDWITLSVIFVIAVVGAVYFVIARPDRLVSGHVHDELEATGAERAVAG